ncbi:MAG: PQQ-binding-like beta-propeller repeat protein, partial [Candidatus Omnitrophica bacterium]|nr:PQQ-binding-like beta-propeller repeat protein [Candidatus Omnitrophota bacterium]
MMVRVFLIAFLMTLIALPHSYSVDWEQYNGNDSTRTTPEKIDLSTLKGNQAKVLWKVPVRNGFSSFSTAGDKIFTLVTRKDQDGIERECCVALNANTGEEIWAQFLGFAKYDGGGDSGTETNRGGDGARSTPSNDGERVYVYDSRMNLYCFDIEDGSVKWQKSIEKDFDGREIRWQSAASPLLMDYLCIVYGGGEGQTMIGLDKRNGSVMGAVGDDLMTHATPIRANIHGVEQAIFFLQSGVTSVDVSDGQILWHFDFPYV